MTITSIKDYWSLPTAEQDTTRIIFVPMPYADIPSGPTEEEVAEATRLEEEIRHLARECDRQQRHIDSLESDLALRRSSPRREASTD